MMQRQLDLPQGTVHAHDTGGDGPVLVFVHGVLVDHTLWDDVDARLAPAHRCVALDLPLGAHREAMRPDADLSPPGLARLVADALAALDLEDVVLVGNDTGGAICQLVAAAHPERLGALVLTDCDAYEHFFPPILRPLQWLARAPRLGDAALRATRFGAVRTAVIAPVNRRRDPERSRRWAAPLLADAAVRRDALKVIAGVDARHTLAAARALRSFDRPALLLWSPDDRIFPIALAERLAAELPDARLERVPGARAFLPMDAPEVVADRIGAFAATLSAGVPSRTR